MHHQRAFERYLAAERALVIAAELRSVDPSLVAERDAARHVATGYAELIVAAEGN